MKSKNQLGLTLSLFLLSATTAIAQPKPNTSPQIAPSPTTSTQQQKELEKLQQEKEIRNTVQTEVDRAFSRTTTMLNILLVVLTILPIGTAFIIWFLRRSVVSQLVTETKEPIEKEISKAKADAETQLHKLVSDNEQEMEDIKNKTTSELQHLVSSLLVNTKQQLETEILQVKTDIINQLQNIINEAENLSKRIKQDIANATQEIGQAKAQGIRQLDNAKKEIESRKTQTISQVQNSTNQLIAEAKEQIRREIEKAKYDALNQINRAVFEVQQEKTRIIAKLTEMIPKTLSEITPETLFANLAPEIKQEIQELITQLKSLESNSPDLVLTPDDYFKQGNALFFIGDYDGAIKSYDQALEIKPDFYPGWYNRGEVLVRLTRYQNLFPDSELSDEHKQQYGDAIASYEKALEIKPDFHEAWYNRAECYALIKKVDLAIEDLKQAIQLNPEYKTKAQNDPDFDEIREDERFKQLIED